MDDLVKEASVVAVIPPGPDDFDFDQIDCLPVGPKVTIVDDFELLLESGAPVLEIIGDASKIVFFTQCSLPIVNFHIKNIEKFITITVTFNDSEGGSREVNFNTKRSIVTVEKAVANLPVVIGVGWQFLQLDFSKIASSAFGCNYSACTEITVHGSCRLSKVFFTKREVADVELPTYLRVCQL